MRNLFIVCVSFLVSVLLAPSSQASDTSVSFVVTLPKVTTCVSSVNIIECSTY